MSFALNTGRFVGSAAATVIHGTRIGTSNFALGTKQGYAERAAALQAKRIELGLSNVAPAEVAAPTPITKRRVRAA